MGRSNTTGYRGEERRRGDAAGAVGRAWVIAAGLLLLVLVSTVGLVLVSNARLGATAVVGSVFTATAMAGIGLSGTAYAHWRAVGRLHGLLVAVAGVLLTIRSGTSIFGVFHSYLAVELAGFALTLMAAVWVGRAAWGPEVDTRRGPGRELALACLMALGVFVVSTASTALGLDDRVATSLASSLASVTWAVVGIGSIHQSVRRGWGLLGWVGLGAVALGLAEGAGLAAEVDGAPWAFASGVMATSGLLAAGLGGTFALARVALAHRGDVHGILVESRTGDAPGPRHDRELRHEVRNALVAIDGAASTLDEHDDLLGDEQRRRLRRTMRSGVTSLQELVAEPAQAQRYEAFALDEVVDERVAATEARGIVVHPKTEQRVEVSGWPAAAGRAIDNLLLNAERHGHAGRQDRPVRVAVTVEESFGVLRVMDDGAGVPPDEREAIFRAGYRCRHEHQGEGIGLSVARELVRAQSGELVYEQRAEGGACFVLSLPLAARTLDAARTPTAHEVDDGR